MDAYEPTERTRVRRLPARGAYDRATVHAILDEGLVGHLAVVSDGAPRVLPTTYARIGETVYVHGSSANRTLRDAAGCEVCFAVTLLDGLVLARSAFHHSMNYRSVVVYAQAREVREPGEVSAALDAIVDRAAAGRSAQARKADAKELRATLVLAIPLREVSAKVRTGGPVDDAADMDLPVWAGVVPLHLVRGDPVPDATA